MKKEFIPYEEALALKELGFDEECICFYKDGKLQTVDQHWGTSLSGISKRSGYRIDDLILTPLFQQAFRWFRENYGLESHVNRTPPEMVERNELIKKYHSFIWKETLNRRG